MKKTALVTGASLGIGLEFSRVLAQAGYDLVLVARSAERLKALTEQIFQEASERHPTISIQIVVKDLSVTGSGLELFQELKSKGILIDVLINNAGFGDFGLFHDLKLERQLQMIDLNVRSLTELTHLFGKEMILRRSGKILNVASTAAFQPGPLLTVYYATKHYVLAFSEGLAHEWKDFGVTVTALCPGPTESGFQEAANMGRSKLFQRFRLPSSASVAAYGFRAMNEGKVVAVHGRINWLGTKLVKFVPRKWLVSMVRLIQEKASS